MPCRHDQMLSVVCRILASLSHCWFVCVLSPVGWLQYSGSPSDVQRLSTRTVRNRLKSAGLKSRRVIKHPLLADWHRRSRLAWCLARRGWNLRTWRKIHWSDESRLPVRLPCMVTKSSLQSWEIHPKPLLSLHRQWQLAGCSLGYRLYFCVFKPSSGRWFH
jgi:hypothetical protein